MENNLENLFQKAIEDHKIFLQKEYPPLNEDQIEEIRKNAMAILLSESFITVNITKPEYDAQDSEYRSTW